MPTVRIPIEYRVVTPSRTEPDAPIRRVLRASVPLRVSDGRGLFRLLPGCRFDSGCGTTMMSAVLARALGVPFPQDRPHQLPIQTANGVVTSTVHHGELTVRFDALPDTAFRLFCLFSEQYPPNAPLLLGLHDTLEVFRVELNGRRSPGAEVGEIVFETVG